jgi:DNA-binding LytR/AlgR family response regulator
MMISCAIIDDEYPARMLLKSYIAKFPHLKLIGIFKSPLEVLPLLQEGQIDLIFLDIQMPDISGVEFLRAFHLKKTMVVITSAYPEYALEGYQLDVIDYLLKPFAFGRFAQAVRRAGERIQLREGNLTSIVKEEVVREQEYIIVKADHKTFRINTADILFIEGLREYVTFHCLNQKLISLESLKKLEETLPKQSFLRVHKSYIVNKNQVKTLYGNQLQMHNTSLQIPIGSSYRDMVKKTLF